MHWGAAIRKVRILRGMTQQALADRTGRSQSAIARFERTPDLLASTLELMAAALDVRIEDFCELAASEGHDGEDG